MAECSFFVLPADPLYLPSEAQQQAALVFFEEVTPFPNANGSYTVYIRPEPQLLDAGEGLEVVICPECEKRLEVMTEEDEELDAWWQSFQDGDMGEDARTEMPCCGAEVPVLSLTFDMPSYFHRFAIGSLEPSYGDYWADPIAPRVDPQWLKPETIARFEEIMGCKVRQMWRIGH